MNEIINFGNGKRVKVVMMRGLQGEDGRGIVSIEKTSTLGRVDTYTITYTDGTTSTFEVTNGGGSGGAVDTVNGQTGNVVLDAEDVGALPDTTTLADLTQDSTHRTVTDAQITDWTAKVGSVNGQTGNVQLSASDVGALPSDTTLAQLPQSSAYRTVSDAEKSTWNGKANGSEVSAIVNVYGAKNLNVYPYQETTVTTNGVTFNDNGDGSITVNGATTSAYAVFSMRLDGVSPIKLKKGTYTLSGCPNKSGLSMVFQFDVNGETISVTDLGNGATFTLNADATTKWCYLYVDSNIDLSTAVTFYPMLRDARISDSTYVPYALTNSELSKKTTGLSNRNLLDNAWFTINQRGTSGAITSGYGLDRWRVENGTFTINSDGTLTCGAISYQSQYANLGLVGKQVTFSVLLSDNSIKSVTFNSISANTYNNIYDSENNWTFAIDTRTSEQRSGSTERIVFFNADDTNSVTIKALKIELGTESTLALDVAPNYATELMKCQRYYRKMSLYDCIGMTDSNQSVASTHYVNSVWDAPMRAIPTVTFSSGTVVGNKYNVGGALTKTITSISSDINGNLTIDTDTSGDAFQSLSPVFVNATGIEFNAEL